MGGDERAVACGETRNVHSSMLALEVYGCPIGRPNRKCRRAVERTNGEFFSYLTNDLEYGRVGRGDDCDLYRDGHAGRIQHIDRHACLTAFLANSSDFRNWASTGHHRTKIVNNITAFFWKWQVESRVQHWCFSVYFFALIEVFLVCCSLLCTMAHTLEIQFRKMKVVKTDLGKVEYIQCNLSGINLP